MRFESLRFAARSLRFRLTAWNTVVLVLTVVGSLVVVRESIRYMLLEELDQILREDIQEVGLIVERSYPDLDAIHQGLDLKARGHVQHRWFVQLIDAGGAVIWSSQNTPDTTLPPTATPAPQPFTFDHHRFVVERIQAPGIPPMRARVAASLRFIEQDLSRVTRVLVVVGLGIVFVAPIGGFWLAGRATKPLAEIIRTTGRLHPDNLAERLTDRGTGDELDRLSQTINGLLDRLAAYIRQKRDFIANAAHDLRSPLTAIRGSVEVALSAERSAQAYQELLAEVAEECSSLGRLVNQLLLLAESDAGTLEARREKIRLDHILAKGVEMFRGVAETRGVEVVVVHLAPVVVQGDCGHARQVINNLLDNAIKFTPNGGKVEVDLRLDPSTSEAVLRVNDTGSGIAPEDIPKVFDRFYRGDKSRSRENPTTGSGLGLSICKSIVNAMGGTIEASSILGKGTSMEVRIPSARVVRQLETA